jgi:hypothetical protein
MMWRQPGLAEIKKEELDIREKKEGRRRCGLIREGFSVKI